MRLSEIGETGELLEEIIIDDFLRGVIEATVAHYRRTGFVPPWIGYVGLNDEVPVGVCGYKSQPVDGRVEIAYLRNCTRPRRKGSGHSACN